MSTRVTAESGSRGGPAPFGSVRRVSRAVAGLGGEPFAPLTSRALAFGMDSLLLGLALAPTAWWAWRQPSLLSVSVVCGIPVVFVLAYGVVQGMTGMTPGKAVVGIRAVHHESGHAVGVARGLLREAARAAAAWLTLGLGVPAVVASILASDRDAAAHDRAGRSVVLSTRRRVRRVAAPDEAVAAGVWDPGQSSVADVEDALLMAAARAAEMQPVELPAEVMEVQALTTRFDVADEVLSPQPEAPTAPEGVPALESLQSGEEVHAPAAGPSSSADADAAAEADADAADAAYQPAAADPDDPAYLVDAVPSALTRRHARLIPEVVDDVPEQTSDDDVVVSAMASVSHDGRGSLVEWELVLPDGRIGSVGRHLLLGRDPVPREGETVDYVAAVHDPERTVAKTHVLFQVVRGGLEITDRGSQTGTVVLVAGSPRQALAPGVPLRVTGPATVHAGSYVVTVRPFVGAG